MMPRRHAGFATLIVLVTMAWLALIGMEIVSQTRAADQFAENLKRSAAFEAAAEGAVVHAVYAHAAAHDSGFEPNGPPQIVDVAGIRVAVVVRRESDFINLNRCPVALMRSFLAALGVPQERASELADAIADAHDRPRGPRPGGGPPARYLRGRGDFGASGDAFRSVDELRVMPGMDPKLFALMAPHLTLFSSRGPDTFTRDPVVAEALRRTPGSIGGQSAQTADGDQDVLRIVTTIRTGAGTDFTATYVARADFAAPDPAVRILLRMQ